MTQANETNNETKEAGAKEKVQVEVMGSYGTDGKLDPNLLEDNLNNITGIEGVPSPITSFPVAVTVDGYGIIIDENGKVSMDISEYVQVGQLVDYDPTVLDKSGTPVDAEGIAEEDKKLVYKSTQGSGTEHGNGNGEQIFTAKTNSDVKWRVLSIENGAVQLISENAIKTDAGSNFIMKGALGYLYAEQELNEICKIYGYGYGADTTQVTTYTYGGPKDLGENGKELTGKITGSGARSITIEDINKQAGIYEDSTDGKMKYSDGTVISSSYGSTENPTTEIFYPTISTTNGKSTDKTTKLKYTSYSYSKDKVDIKIRDILFNGNYWLASRCVNADSSNSYFNVRNVGSGISFTYSLCYGGSNLGGYAYSNFAIRPVVTLKSNIIDVDAGYNEETGWSLK